MSAPERIFISPDMSEDTFGTLKLGSQIFFDTDFDGSEAVVEYIRADIHEALTARMTELEDEVKEHDALFDLRWQADMRAIKRWKEAGGDNLTWPDHADLCVWLLERVKELEAALVTIEEPIDHGGEGWAGKQCVEIAHTVQEFIAERARAAISMEIE